MKILIIAYFFPPQNVIASLRPYSWAKYFYEQGHEITVATIKHNKRADDLNYDISNFKIIQETYWIPFRKVNTSVISNEYSNNKKESSFDRVYKTLKNVTQQYISSSGILYGTRYPDLRMNWVRKILNKLKSESFDVVISTGCPYIVHSIAYKLKKKNPNLFWVLDWRDLWTQNSNFLGLKIFHRHEKRIERTYHNTCDFITTISDGLQESLQQITTKDIHVIYNGYNPDEYAFLYKRERKKNSRLTIAYLGTLYKGFRDPEPLLIAIKDLINEKKLSQDDINLIFAGYNSDIKDIVKKYQLEDCYKYLGAVTREKSLEIQYDADILLFLESEHKTKGILTGKLFEYLSLGRKIWAIGIENSNSAGELIVKSNIGICLGTSNVKIKNAIISALSEDRYIEKDRNPIVAFYERNRQAQILLDLIKEKKKICK